jgi:hypothetical protein
MNQCSFAFRAVKQSWVNEPDPADKTRTLATRQLQDLDLSDVSVVTYPAYSGTSANVDRSFHVNEIRAFFPEGVPDDVMENVTLTVDSIPIRLSGAGVMKSAGLVEAEKRQVCACDCPECRGGNCADCSNEDCADAACNEAEGNSSPNEQEQRQRELALLEALL